MSTDPKLSIVVTIVDGGTYLRDFLQALYAMEDTPPMEVIVPYDASEADAAAFAADFPEVNFLDLGEIVPERPITTEAGHHELFDRAVTAPAVLLRPADREVAVAAHLADDLAVNRATALLRRQLLLDLGRQ